MSARQVAFVALASCASTPPAAPTPSPAGEEPRSVGWTKLEPVPPTIVGFVPLPISAKEPLARAHVRDLIVMIKFCAGTDGVTSFVKILKGTGYESADAELADGVRRWRFRPWVEDGRPVPFCSAMIMKYTIDPL